MLRRQSSAFKILISAFLAGMFLTTTAWAQTQSPWDSAGRSNIGSAAKKKKTKKRAKVGSKTRSSRMKASTAAASRRLAQNDLESDLEADLEAELSLGAEDSPSTEAPPDLESSLERSLESELSAEAGAEPQAVMGDDVQILDIAYDSKQDGGTVIIQTTGPATFRTREVPSQNQVVVEIANAKLPERLKRPFNTKDFRQAIVSLNAYQEAGSNTARVVLQFRQPRTVTVRQEGQRLKVVAGDPVSSSAGATSQASRSDDFDSEEVLQNNLETGDGIGASSTAASQDSSAGSSTDASFDSSNSVSSSSARSSSPRPTQAAGAILPSSSLDQERIGDIRFYGRPISIEVRDTPVRDVITLIADQSGANIIMSDDVTGAITIKLRQVPWDQALSIIMKTRGLGYVRQAGVLRVAPIRQLQAEAEEARRIIDAQEATQPLRVRVIPVSFANVTLLATQIRNTLQSSTGGGATAAPAGGSSTGRGKIEADPRSSSLIITDTDDNIRRIEQLVKALDTAPLQVMIEGKIVEAREETGRRLGVNWGYQGEDLGFGGLNLSHRGQISPTINAPNTTLDLKLGTLDFLGDLNARLALFESESLVKIISSPRVITMNSQKATIEQSVSIAIPTQTITPGAPAVTTITYRTIPTILDVTPQITPGGDVLMQIAFRREFQAGSVLGADVPIESRDIKTNVMVKNGQTTVIGGIYQSDQTESDEGTPFLRKVPILGWLFKSNAKSNRRNELLVFITPRILNADRTLPKAGTVQ